MSKRQRSPSPDQPAPRTRARLQDYDEYATDEEFELDPPGQDPAPPRAPTNTGQVDRRFVINVEDEPSEEEEELAPSSSASSALIARHQAERAARPFNPPGIRDLPPQHARAQPRPQAETETLRLQTRMNPMSDETVLTAILLFGVFFEANWPTELVALLFDWIQRVFRAKDGLHIHFKTDCSRAAAAPILYVNPTLSPNPIVIHPNCRWTLLSDFDLDHHRSLKNLTFFEFIQRTCSNIIILYRCYGISLSLRKDFYERVHRCCSSAYPGKPYYLSAFLPDLMGPHATAATTLPKVSFDLVDVKDQKLRFSFSPIPFPAGLKKIFISVVVRPPKLFQRLATSSSGYYLEPGYYDNACSPKERELMEKLGCTEFSGSAAYNSENVAPGVVSIFNEPPSPPASIFSLEAAGVSTEEGLKDSDGRMRLKFFIPGTDEFTFVTGDV